MNAVLTMDVKATAELQNAAEAIRRILTGPDLQAALLVAAAFADHALPEGLRRNAYGPVVAQPRTPTGATVCGPRERATLTQALLRVRNPAVIGQQTLQDLNLILDCALSCPHSDTACLDRWQTQ